MKYRFVIVFFLILCSSSSSFAQKQYLAKIGETILSADEFKQRYELTPKIKSDFNSDSTKINFLFSLIAEELWSLEAKSLGMDTVQYVINSTKNIEKKLVKDKFYKIEIENRVKITDNEILQGIMKQKEKRILSFLFSKNEDEIKALYNKLLSGSSIDSLLVGRLEKAQQVGGISVVYGQMDKHLEDEIFSLKLNQFTKPIPVKIGWVIYYLQKIELNKTEDLYNENGERKKVEEVIFARKAKILYNEFFNKYLKGNIVHSDKSLFNKLVNDIFVQLKENMDVLYNENIKKYQLDEYQIKSIASRFSEKELNSDFIKFEVAPISLKIYLINLELNGFNCTGVNKGVIANTLNGNLKAYIFEEILFREGYKRGLQNSEEIKRELKTWHNSFLASYYKYTFLDTINISEDDATNMYNQIILKNSDFRTESFKDVKELIKNGLYFKELDNLYIDKTVALAEKYGLSVNYELLNSLKTTEVEMMVYRVLGFGGEITAVPYLQPFYKWKSWLPKSIKNPLKD